jgi:hypothetical protein
MGVPGVSDTRGFAGKADTLAAIVLHLSGFQRAGLNVLPSVTRISEGAGTHAGEQHTAQQAF